MALPETHFTSEEQAQWYGKQPVPLKKAIAPNQIWAMDLMTDTLENVRTIRVINLKDTFSKESIIQIVDSSLHGNMLIRKLSQLQHNVDFTKRSSAIPVH